MSGIMVVVFARPGFAPQKGQSQRFVTALYSCHLIFPLMFYRENRREIIIIFICIIHLFNH